MNFSVLGSGRWGSFIAWYLHEIGHNVTLYGRSGGKIESLKEAKKSGQTEFSDEIKITSDLCAAAENKYIFISIASQNFRALLAEMKENGLAKGKILVLCMKGIEQATGKRLTEVVTEICGDETASAIWVGPGHAEDFRAGIPNCMVIDSADEALTKELAGYLQSPLIRFYYGTDLIGNEIGAAAKNVIGIAAGLLDGLSLGALKGALMSRGPREVARFICALGGKEITAYGLAHLGDYEATLFSKFSHNRRFGEMIIKGEPYSELAEGVYTVSAMLKLGEEKGVELPIFKAVADIIHNGEEPKKALAQLFSRSAKDEFYY